MKRHQQPGGPAGVAPRWPLTRPVSTLTECTHLPPTVHMWEACVVLPPSVSPAVAERLPSCCPAVRYLRAMGAVSKERLDAMVEEATVDCYNEAEQVSGFFTMIEERVAVPFETQVLGVDVTVESVDMTEDDQIVAICSRNRFRQAIPILELPLPTPPPQGAEWIEAYRYWLGGALGT